MLRPIRKVKKRKNRFPVNSQNLQNLQSFVNLQYLHTLIMFMKQTSKHISPVKKCSDIFISITLKGELGI